MSKTSAALLLSLGLCLTALPAGAAEGFGVPADYRLSMKTVEACHGALVAVMTAARTDSALKAEMTGFGEDDENDPDIKTVDWLTKEMERKAPRSVRLMAKKGCDAGTFWTSTLAMTEAGLTMAAAQMGGQPVDAPANVKANMELLLANQTRFEQIGAEQQALMAEFAPEEFEDPDLMLEENEE